MKFQKKIKKNNINSKIIYSIQSKLSHLLNRLDKMSMASSIEIRLPFLDENVFKFSQNLPMSFKSDKKILKLSLKKYLKNFFQIILYTEKKMDFLCQ